jgi:phosphoglycolate phosphatase
MTGRLPRDVPHWRGEELRAVLFDLDGTLMDTADDITVILNRALAEQHLGSLPPNQVRELIGRGIPTLIARAVERLGRVTDAASQAALLERFYFHHDWLYRLDERRASLYPDVAEVLERLHGLGLKLAVVTNKKRDFAVDLLARSGLSAWIHVVVGGDSCARGKPDPQPLHFACDAVHVDPSRALMVGDSLTDVLAARAAGMPVVCVPYGYNEGRDPHTLPCDAFIDTLADLPGLLLSARAPCAALRT